MSIKQQTNVTTESLIPQGKMFCSREQWDREKAIREGHDPDKPKSTVIDVTPKKAKDAMEKLAAEKLKTPIVEAEQLERIYTEVVMDDTANALKVLVEALNSKSEMLINLALENAKKTLGEDAK